MSGIDTISTTPDHEHLLENLTKEQENVPYRSPLSLAQTQGPRCAFLSGPTEETIEFQRHERVESTRWVSFHPPLRFFLNFERFYVRF